MSCEPYVGGNDMEEKDRLNEKILKWRDGRHGAQKKWSFVHHMCVFGSVGCSLVAGTVINISKDLSTLTTALACTAAVLTGIAGSGGFRRKWRSNRLSRCTGDCLLIDLDTENPDLQKIRDSFRAAIQKHDLEVVGDEQD